MRPPLPRPAGPSARIVLGALALILVGLGQFNLLLQPNPAGWPVWLMVAGSALFLLVLVLPATVWNKLPRRAQRLPARPMWLAAAAVLSAGATALSLANQSADRRNYLPVLLLWFGAMAVYVAGFADPAWAPDWRGWRRRYGREVLWVGLLFLAGAALRFYQLGHIPRVINGDEGVLGQAALNTATNPLANPFALFENFGSLYLQGMALAMRLFGETAFALRLLPALGGVLALLALYLFARYLFGVRVGLLSVALMAVSHAHIHFSRTVAVGYIQGTLLTPLELYFFYSGLEKRSSVRTALAGLLLGLHFNIYLSAQIIVGVLVLYLLVAALLCRPLIQRAWRQVAVLAGALAVSALPSLVYAIRTPEQFLARLNSDGTFQSGWLAEQVAQTGRGPVAVLADRVVHAFLSLNYYRAGDFYGAPIPLLDVLTSILFILGLAYCLVRTRLPRELLLNGWFWGATVSIGVFSIPASADSYRMLIALPAALIMAAIGLDQLAALLAPDTVSRRARLIVAGAALAAVFALNVRTYFIDFAAQCRYGGDPQTRFASYLGSFLRPLDREMTVFLLSDDIFQYGTHSSVDFLSNRLPVTNVPEPIDTLVFEPNTAVIAIAERADELRAWARAHPGGSLERHYDCEQLMLMAYVIPER